MERSLVLLKSLNIRFNLIKINSNLDEETFRQGYTICLCHLYCTLNPCESRNTTCEGVKRLEEVDVRFMSGMSKKAMDSES